MKQYYIVSLKWTSQADSWITLWRPDGGGYTWNKPFAGVYNEGDRQLKGDDLQVPVDKEVADKLFRNSYNDDQDVVVLPNSIRVRQELGLDARRMRPKKYKTC